MGASKETDGEYVAGIFRRLSGHGYEPEWKKGYVTGGGYCLVKNFGQFDEDRVVLVEDICATAKGYELLVEMQNKQRGIA